MVVFYWYVLCLLDVVHTLEDGQSVTDTRDAHGLEVIMEQSNQGFSDDLIFCLHGACQDSSVRQGSSDGI